MYTIVPQLLYHESPICLDARRVEVNIQSSRHLWAPRDRPSVPRCRSLTRKVLFQNLLLVDLPHGIPLDRVHDLQDRRDLVRGHILFQISPERLQVDILTLSLR